MANLKFDGTAANTGGASTKNLYGTSNAETITGSKANENLWGTWGDTLIGGAGDATYYVQGDKITIVELAGEGIDTIVAYNSIDLSLYANVENLKVSSDNLAKAYGNALDNVVQGGTGSQEIYGGLGQDVLSGGAGADTFIVKKGEGNDVILDFSQADGDKIKLTGAGLDTFAKIKAAMTQVGADTKIDMGGGDALLVRNVKASVLTAADFGITETTTTSSPPPTQALTMGKNFYGTANSETVTGTSGADNLWGTWGDTLIGGAGNDTYYLQGDKITIIEKANEGIDTIIAYNNVDLTNYANVEKLVVESDNLVKAYGNALDNVIQGGRGSQEIYGGLGLDTLGGGAGADTFIVKKGEGNDVIRDFKSAEGDKIKLTATGLETFDKIKAAMTQVGADTKIDMGGGDFLLLQNVTASSLTAADFGVAAAAPVVSQPVQIVEPVIEPVAPAPIVSQPTTTPTGPADYSINPVFTSTAKASAGVTKHFYGSTAKETITGTAGHDGLWGGQGDTLLGGLGDDTYYYKVVGDRAIEYAGGGVDTITGWQSVNLAKTPYIENVSISGNGLYAAGNDLDNLVSGGSGSEEIYGGKGQDILTGGAGSDTFIVYKGEGNDVIRDFSAAEDVIRLKAGFSTFDQVKSHMTQVGSDVVLNMGDGDGLLLKNVSLSSLSAKNFQLQIDYSKLGAMTFSEEFNSLSLYSKTYNPTGKWTPDLGYGDINSYTLTNNGEKQICTSPYFHGHAGDFSESPFVVNGDGTVSIWAKQSTNSEIYGYGYTSGVLTTKNSFSQLYGYFEMRADLPEAAGVWPAFWMLPSNGAWPPELDIMEVLGDGTTVHTTAHTRQTGTHTSAADTNFTPQTSDGMHTYGALWSPEKLVYFVDGVEVFETATPADMNTKMYMLVNMAMGGWAGAIDNSALGAEMKIDYVRAYALPDNWATLF